MQYWDWDLGYKDAAGQEVRVLHDATGRLTHAFPIYSCPAQGAACSGKCRTTCNTGAGAPPTEMRAAVIGVLRITTD